MKVIHVVLDDEDYERLVEAKRSLGAKSWRELIFKLLNGDGKQAKKGARGSPPP